jgi:predicted molibdopterin-dependent oxidoreductase YjgC
MFRRLPDRQGDPITFTFDGRPLTAAKGDSLAAALLAAGITRFRTAPVSGAERGPYCMMGVCFECLVVVDGRSNRQACLIPVEEGMRVETQQGKASYAGGAKA